MNTPAHLIFGTAAFGKPGNPRVTAAAVAGALTPDLTLYLMVGWSIYIRDIAPRTVFREYYYSPEWQQVFAIDNSFVLWGLFLALAFWAKKTVLVAFAGAGFLHLCFDFPFHNHDARMHFWPLTDWVFVSPVSYWDSRHYASVVEPMELGAAMLLCVVLLMRHKAALSRGLIALLAASEVVASGFFRWFL